MTIYFYSTNNQYGEFSNFAPYGIELDGVWWPTTEHYFQAQKFENAEYRERIRAARAPKIAAELGRSRKMPLRADWEQIKDDVMYRAVRKKFETHAQLRDLLLSTGDEDIVENAPGDYYLTVTGISEKAVPVASYDIDDVQEYTSSPRSHHLGGGANDRAC